MPATTAPACPPRIVSRAEWLDARKALLAREKELTRLHDRIAAQRRALAERGVAPGAGLEAVEAALYEPYARILALTPPVEADPYEDHAMVARRARYGWEIEQRW